MDSGQKYGDVRGCCAFAYGWGDFAAKVKDVFSFTRKPGNDRKNATPAGQFSGCSLCLPATTMALKMRHFSGFQRRVFGRIGQSKSSTAGPPCAPSNPCSTLVFPTI